MDEWVWSNGGMILTGENWSTGRKNYTVWVVDEWMSMEQWWNDTDRGKLKYWEKKLYSVGGWWMNEWVWSNSGMIMTGENWSTGRKTLYSISDRWMDNWMNEWINDEWIWSNGRVVLTGENQSTWNKAFHSASLYPTKPTWTGLGFNLSLCS